MQLFTCKLFIHLAVRNKPIKHMERVCLAVPCAGRAAVFV